MDKKCYNCKNLALCTKIHEGSCADCAESIERLAEHGCKFGGEQCTYIENLRKQFKNQDCEFKENLKDAEECPRCKDKNIDRHNEYSSGVQDLLSGVVLMAHATATCKTCKLKYDEELGPANEHSIDEEVPEQV